MLKPHRLDDQNFIDIVGRSRRLIQKYAAGWTNENASDPGITILEMLAWMKDNMQYYMDQSHLISKSAYMDLLGIRQLSGQAAEMIATVRFTDLAEDDYKSGLIRQTQILPEGFPVWADGTRFELAGSAQVQVSNIMSIYSSNSDFSGSIADLIGAFENDAAAYPFGTEPKSDNCLYIGFDDIRSGILSFFVDVEDDPLNYRNPYDFNKILFAKGVWELADSNNGEVQWIPLELILDETHTFMDDGIVTLKIDHSIRVKKLSLLKGDKNLVWLRFRLVEANYDRPPIIENITMNAVRLKQVHTVLKCHSLIKHMTGTHMDILIEDYVPEGAQLILEMKTKTGYKVVDPTNYSVAYNDNGTMTLILGEHYESVDIANLRLISGEPSFGGIKTYDIKGLPYESIDTVLKNVLFNSIMIEVNEDHFTDKWIPWTPVHHLWTSQPDDRHIKLNTEAGTLEFGNNELGMLPDSKENALRIIEAKTSLKDKGNGTYRNLLIDEINSSVYAFTPISKASGGRQLETEEEAFDRFNQDNSGVTRMMSRSHIEAIIKNTPGLAIRDVSVIAGASTSEEGRIIALPKSEGKNPELPDIYVDVIKRQIESSRLITEHWKVTGPDYVSMKAKLEIIKDPAVHVEPDMIQEVVSRFIEPETGKLFGRRFSVGRLKRRLESINGILRVSRLSLRTIHGAYKRADGDIQLPDSAIGYLADIDLQILDDQGW